MTAATSKSKSKTNLIKGYLPIRLSLPMHFSDENKVTFMYIKEHNQNTSSRLSTTLFVVNAPMVPNISTHLFLHSLFSKFGEVEKVIVVRNPRSSNSNKTSTGLNTNNIDKTGTDDNEKKSDSISWSEKYETPQSISSSLTPSLPLSCCNIFGFDKNILDEGKFAHVIFVSNKEMKKTLSSIRKLQSELCLDPSELSRLVSDSKQYLLQQQQKPKDDESSDSDEESKDGVKSALSSSSILTCLVNKRKRNTIPRSVLMNYCNSAMAQFETVEEEAAASSNNRNSEPDEDGFITVSYSNAVGSKRQMEDDTAAFGGSSMTSKEYLERRRGNTSKRARKRKDTTSGSSELKDFYRFQMRETRKKNIEELRSKFEEDLKAVQKIKEKKGYRPF